MIIGQIIFYRRSDSTIGCGKLCYINQDTVTLYVAGHLTEVTYDDILKDYMPIDPYYVK